MKTTDVKTIVACPGRNSVLVKILTGKGLYRVGEAALNTRALAVAEALRKRSQVGSEICRDISELFPFGMMIVF